MELTQLLMIVVFVATFIGLIKCQQTPERIFAGSVLACLALSFVNTEQILTNATNTGVVTLILLVVCSFAFERTSFLRRISVILINGSVVKSYIRTFFSAAFASAVMNNTAVVASLLTSLKNNQLINPGKLLLPLSYVAILGGTLTLIGTSTNLIVNSMWIERGHQSFEFFDFIAVGAVALFCCIVIILLTVNRLPKMQITSDKAQEYFLEAQVEVNSSLIGKSIEENGLRNLDGLFLVEVIKNKNLISPVSPHYRIAENDRLIFTGDISKVLVLAQFDGLKLFAECEDLLRDNLTEVLLKPDSAVVGKTLKSSGFRARFDAAVVAIRREGSQLSGKLGEVTLKAGDLLVLAAGKDFRARTNISKNFFVLSGVEPENMLTGWKDKLVIVGFILAISISLFLSVPLLETLMFYLATLLITGSLSINEIKRRFPIELFTIVVGALTLATALENTGVARLIADNVELLLKEQGTYLVLIVIFILTLIMTELITNNAAAALMFPIAYNMALGLGGDPLPFVMAVAFAASGSFITPYGYQTNVMVYNAGNYKFGDFVKFGLPVSIIYSIAVLTMIPIMFPL